MSSSPEEDPHIVPEWSSYVIRATIKVPQIRTFSSGGFSPPRPHTSGSFLDGLPDGTPVCWSPNWSWRSQANEASGLVVTDQTDQLKTV